MSDLYDDMMIASSLAEERYDCTVIALAIAGGIDYAQARKMMREKGRINRKPVSGSRVVENLELLGFKVTFNRSLPAKTVRAVERLGIKKALLLGTRGHILALKDGIAHDWTSGRLHRIEWAATVTKRNVQK